MSTSVALHARTVSYHTGGGHQWVYLNWALGLRSAGCKVYWLESVDPTLPDETLQWMLETLRGRLNAYGLNECISLCSFSGDPVHRPGLGDTVSLDEVAQADLFLDLSYGQCSKLLNRMRRSAFIDIDPGLTQIWIGSGCFALPEHDAYFTIGETVGHPGARFPDLGILWNYTSPCVSLEHWKPQSAPASAPFTTVTHWRGREWVCYEGESYCNDKRAGFLPFLDLPRRVPAPMELAVCLGKFEDDSRAELMSNGWRIRDSGSVTSTPLDYQDYLGGSFGEFSCAKPSCVHLQNAWISDRTLCYLASGKPAVVQHTGLSRFLPEAEGLLRFRDMKSAVAHVERVCGDYAQHSRSARMLAEEFFDAKKVAQKLLEKAL